MCASVTKQYNLVQTKEWLHSVAGKVTVGLVLHWPCVTRLSDISTCGLMTKGRKMSTLSILLQIDMVQFINDLENFSQLIRRI